MTVGDYRRILRKQWIVVLVSVALALGVAAAVTFTATPQYAASIKMFVSSQDGKQDAAAIYQGGLFSQQRVKSYADLLNGPRVAEGVVQNLGLSESAASVQRRLSATALPDTVLLQATVTDPSPSQARDIANAVGEQFAVLVDDLERPVGGGASTVKVTVVEQAELPSVPVSPAPLRNLGLALVLGLIVGFGLALLRETLDMSVKSPDDVGATTGGLATLGAVPFDPEAAEHPLIGPTEAHSRRSEAMRQLRTNLQFVDITEEPTSIVVTSSLPWEGKSTTSCNLAVTLAQAGVKVLLVEADLRRPRLMTYLGMEGAVGLTSVLIHRADVDEAIQSWGDGLLDVLPSGQIPPNPSELLGSPAMRDLLKQLQDRYDIVLLDSPPLLPVTDAAVLSVLADGVLIVVRANRTRREHLAQAVEALHAVDARILGVVLNMLPSQRSRGYGYGYGYGPAQASRPRWLRHLRYRTNLATWLPLRRSRTKPALVVPPPPATTAPAAARQVTETPGDSDEDVRQAVSVTAATEPAQRH